MNCKNNGGAAIFVMFIVTFLTQLIHGCTQIKDVGVSCAENSASTRYYFDANLEVCQPFLYKGCEGNDNKFRTLNDCIEKCEKRKAFEVSSIATKPKASYETLCNHSFSFLKENEPEQCDKQMNCYVGFDCKAGYCCPTKNLICSQKLDVGHELQDQLYKHITRFGYNFQHGTCNLFTFFGYGGNFNNFPNFESCMTYCST